MPVYTQQQNGNVASVNYGFQTAPWDAPLSWGVQALIEYNGYVINNRHQADRIRVFQITGLDDADISDSREVVPGDHGEFAYDSWYRGRTFVITGQIQAGSLGTLKRLERDLKAAFAPLNESPMKFRWFDVYDSFDDSLTLQNYTPVIGTTTGLTASGGVLNWGTTSAAILMRSADNRLWGDVQETIRVVVGSTSDVSAVYLVPSMLNGSNYVGVAYNAGSGSPTLTIFSVVAGTTHQLQSVPLSGIVQGQSIWLRARREGDLVTAEVWKAPPTQNTIPTFSTSAWLTGSDADTFGDQVLSQVGFGAQTADTNWALDDFTVESISPGDIALNVRKLSPLSMADTQSSLTRFTRNFQLTVRASKPFALGATQTRSQTLVPSSGNVPQLGFSFPLTFPLSFRNFIPGTVALGNNILFVRNRGTAFTRPRIVVYGAISNFTLINLTNNQQITWTGTLPDGDFLVIDCLNRTMTNSIGANQIADFNSSSSAWMWLEPDWNDIFIGGSSYSANTKLTIWSQAAWI